MRFCEFSGLTASGVSFCAVVSSLTFTTSGECPPRANDGTNGCVGDDCDTRSDGAAHAANVQSNGSVVMRESCASDRANMQPPGSTEHGRVSNVVGACCA